MPQITIAYSVLLIILGVAGYALSGAASVTALIPAFFGIVFFILGMVAMRENLRKHAMHGASALALLAILGTFGGVINAVKLVTGAEVERPAAAISQSIMLLLSAVFLGICVNSFIQARRARVDAPSE